MKPYLLKLAGKLILLVILLTGMNNSQAQTRPGIVLKKVLEGASGQLVKDSAVLLQDSIYFSALPGNNVDTPYGVRNIITFRIDEYSNIYIPAPFTATISIRVYYTLPDHSVDSTDQLLTINYDTANAYTMRRSFVFNNSHRVEVKILDLTTDAAPNLLGVMILENEMEVHPAYKLSCTDNAVKTISSDNPAVTDTTDEIVVNWPVSTGADVYDLEWAYVDSSALSSGRYGNPVDPALIFNNNNTRVTLASNRYAIPLLYDNGGVLFYRVRAVQEKKDYVRLETNWSSDYSGGLGAYGFCGHQRNLNWQSSITFAEDGKRKVVVQYFDGSLRSRQTVTKDNTTNTTVVAESFYDYQGRPVIQVMPAPTLSSVLKYTVNLNPAMNGAEYDKDNYDRIETPLEYLTASAKPMSSVSGANNYYSPSNPQKDTGFNKFIPDAEGYAFAETEYTQDNTGRIARQGGLGPTFKLGSGHETKYFYTTPSQEDLDALFGTEVGLNTHYFKNAVQDANGQFSVSYLDMHGRMIATALAGSPESGNLADLPNKEVVTVTDSLSGAGKNIVTDMTMESRKSHFVSQDGFHTFKYELTPPVLQKKNCNDSTLCYKGLYDLSFRITDDVYNLHLRDGKPFDTTISNYSTGVMLTDCGTPAPITMEFQIFLKKGSYEITKSLTISKKGLEYYRDSVFLTSNVCTTLEQVINAEKLKQQTINCFPDCQSCLDSIGTWDEFRVKYVVNTGNNIADTALYRGEALAAYKEATASCEDLCGTTSETDDIREAMLMDMIAPSGQYAIPTDTLNKYSIFYAKDINIKSPYARDTIAYLDEAGNADLVYDDYTNKYVKPQELDRRQFAENFKDTWAASLLKFHPEYCKLLVYQKYKASMTWDADFEKTDSYLEAKQKGYLNPTGIAGLPFPAGTDPLAIEKKALLEARLNNYRGGISLWSNAAIIVKCDANDMVCRNAYITISQAFNESTMCEGDLDMAWRNFRGMYLGIKRDVITDLIKAAVCPVGTTKPTVAELAAAGGKVSRFYTSTELFQQANLTQYTGDNQNAGTVKANADAAEKKMYDDNCKAYVAIWVRQLAPCNYTPAMMNEIKAKLLMVCKEGADREHPRGASSVKPSSVYAYRSFDDVINEYKNQAGVATVLECNAQLLTAPGAYGHQPAYSGRPTFTKPDDCECEKLNVLKREYTALGKPADVNLSGYLKRTRNINMSQTELNTLLDVCNMPPANSCAFLPRPLTIPPFMMCTTAPACATCEDVHQLYNTYISTYPDLVPAIPQVEDSTQLKRNKLFAGFMNNRLGFSKEAWEYLAFMDSCENAPPQNAHNVCRVGSTASKQKVSTYTSSGVDIITDIQRTSDKGYIMAGSTTSLSAGGTDGYLVKTDSEGNLVWAKNFGGEANDEFVRLKTTADGGFIAIGSTSSYCYDRGAILVVKLDALGNVIWNKAIDFGNLHGAKGTDVIQTSNGNYAIAGLRSTSGTYTNWVMGVITDQGELTWLKQIGTASAKKGISLLQNNDTLIAATSVMDDGDYDAVTMKLNIGTGAILSTHQYDIENRGNEAGRIFKTSNGYKLSILNLQDGGYAAGNGVLLDINGGGTVTAAAKMENTNGNTLPSWAVFPAADGGFYATQSVTDVFWHKLRTDNSIEWSKQVRTGGTEKLSSILQDPNGNLAGAGLYSDQYAMLMLANGSGKTGCNDTAIVAASTSIIGFVMPKAVAPQTDTALGSEHFSAISLSEPSLTPVRVALSCPGDDSCYLAGDGFLMCGNAEPVYARVDPNDLSACSDSTFFAVSAGTVLYNAYVDSVKNDFAQDYMRAALEAANLEKFSMEYELSEYQYTLYYYDQAGNLVKTVPPAGVVKDRSGTWLNQVKAARKVGGYLVPGHQMITQYRFNTLNQVVAQKTPDAGLSHFWYDRLGRLVISQNAKQVAGNNYNYTIYDNLGRTTEIGEILSESEMYNEVSRNAFDLMQWINNAGMNKTQIIRTVYDQMHAPLEGLVWHAKNLRNRVSWSAVYNTVALMDIGQRSSGSFYSYDIHGNVKTLIQDFNLTISADTMNRFKRIEYEYDLISGKVNMVSYQPGQVDAFYHKYHYDADNRITHVETSKDSIYWENDAYYQYYKHGPLAKSIIGQQQIQGVDNAYTLQGWLKGVNSTTLTPAFDMGQDGTSGSIVARDAFGFALSFFGNGEYKPVSSEIKSFADGGYSNKPLFNSNVSSISINILKVENPMLYKYEYDVLNRLVGMNASYNLNSITNTWEAVSVNDFKESISYDPNGNIITYNRNGNHTWTGNPLEMDKLSYQYNSGTNKLNSVRDQVSALNYNTDIDSMDVNNYSYDAIGNLINDQKEGISVEWTMYNKIRKITKADNTTINYVYDAFGNRIAKQIGGKETRYVRDAIGNVLSVYVSGDAVINNGDLSQNEIHLYGSRRLGINELISNVQKVEDPIIIPLNSLGSGRIFNFVRGNKSFELVNHLDNVLATVKDDKKGVSIDGHIVDHYEVNLVTSKDYSPFGMEMPGRVYNNLGYRYGFNGKENDNEVKGSGGQQDYGMRIYDPRLGRFLSVDPLSREYPWNSTYAFAENDVMRSIDVDGLEKHIVFRNVDRAGQLISISIQSFEDKDGNPRDNEIYKRTPALSKANVYVITERGVGNQVGRIQYQDKLSPEQDIVYKQFGVRSAVADVNKREKAVGDHFEFNTRSNGLLRGNDFNDGNEVEANLNLQVGVAINFQANTNVPINANQSRRLAGVASTLRLFPNANAVLTGNNGTSAGNPGNQLLGGTPAVLNEAAVLNGQPSTAGAIMTARAGAARGMLINQFGINGARINIRAGARFGNPAGRRVDVRITGIRL